MARGRPVGSTDSYPRTRRPRDVTLEAKRQGLSPLQYMLSVMCDPDVDVARRDKMAVAAAAYMHAKPAEAGKKERAEEEARTNHVGSSWDRLLAGRYDAPPKPVQQDWSSPYLWPSTDADDE